MNRIVLKILAKRNLLLLAILLAASLAKSQTGKTFWFAAPDLNDGSSAIYFRVTTLDRAATVNISQPANGSFTTLTQTIPANSNYRFDLTSQKSQVENTASNEVNNNAILVTSSANISAYYDLGRTDQNDMFPFKGNNALGTNFIITGQKRWPIRYYYSGNRADVMYVAATEYNMVVTIFTQS